MTEQELKDKIIAVLKESRKKWEIITPSIGILDEPRIDIKISKIADTLIAAGLTFDSEWKHRAEVVEHNKNIYCRALYNLSLKYVVADNVTTIIGDDGNEYIAGQEVCALSVMANEVKNSEKELKEKNND